MRESGLRSCGEALARGKLITFEVASGRLRVRVVLAWDI